MASTIFRDGLRRRNYGLLTLLRAASILSLFPADINGVTEALLPAQPQVHSPFQEAFQTRCMAGLIQQNQQPRRRKTTQHLLRSYHRGCCRGGTSTTTQLYGILPSKPIMVGLTAIGAALSIRVVPQGDVAIVERLGKFHKRLDPGLHVLIPVIDVIRQRMTQRERVFDIKPQKCITSDNAPLSADAVVYWRVVNPEKAVYSVVNVELAIENLVLTQLRSEIGKLTLDMTFSAREEINSVLLKELDVATESWGIQITRVEVRDIIPNNEILQAMEMQMAAERTKRSSIIKSEGERERSINEAEGDAQSRLIDAKAKAQAVVLAAEAEATKLKTEAAGIAHALHVIAASMNNGNVDTDGDYAGSTAVGNMNDAIRFQLMRDYISAQRELATSSNAKVIVSSNSPEDIFTKAIAFYDAAAK